MGRADEIRDAQRATWAGLSAGWDRWDSIIKDQLAPVGEAIVEGLRLGEDRSLGEGRLHLDIASGTGEPGLSIARLVPRGRVVLTDLSAEMLEAASRRAGTQRVTNVDAVVCSADGLPFEADTFGSVSVRFGYMFFPDLAEATAELVRVLQPGGRLCSSVWVEPEQNPWTTVAMDAIATEVPLPPPDPDRPGIYRCAGQGHISSLYEGAGLGDVAEWDVEVELVTSSPEQYWRMVSEHVAPAVAAIERVDAEARRRIEARAVSDVLAFEKDGEVRVPGRARCIVGTKRHPAPTPGSPPPGHLDPPTRCERSPNLDSGWALGLGSRPAEA